MHECSPEHLRIGTARMKYNSETAEEGKHKRVNMEKNSGHEKEMVFHEVKKLKA